MNGSATRLRFACSEPLKYGANAAAQYDDPAWPRFVRITDITDDGRLKDETFRSLPPEEAEPYLLVEGDLLLARSGSVGRSFLYKREWGSVCHAGYLIRARLKDSYDPRFVYWALNTAEYWAWVEGIAIRSTIQNISAEKYADYPVPTPPLDAQRRIAAFLDERTSQIDALIVRKQALLERIAEKRQAIITQAVTRGLDPSSSDKESGIDWLPKIPALWEVVALNKITTKITNGYVGATRDLFVDEGVPYLQSLHIKDNRIVFRNDFFVEREWSERHSKSILRTGDVLIVQTGDIGQVAVVPPEFDSCNCHALIVCTPVSQRLDGRFLAWLLNSDYGQTFLHMVKTGALHPHLNCGNVKFFNVLVPPLEEQRQIAGFIDQRCAELEHIRKKVQASLDYLFEYRSALISAAVGGEVEVPT